MANLWVLLCVLAEVTTGSPVHIRPYLVQHPLYSIYLPTIVDTKLDTRLTKQAAEIFVCPGEGNFKDPDNCGRYFNCIQSGTELKASIVECVSGLAYNPELDNCDWAVNVPECSPEEPRDKIPETQPILVEVEEDYECQTEGIFEDPFDCSRYYVCNIKAGNSALASQFVAYAIDCPPGLAFTEKDGWQGCDWPPQEGCPGLVETVEWAPTQPDTPQQPEVAPVAPVVPATPAPAPVAPVDDVVVIGKFGDDVQIIDAKF